MRFWLEDRLKLHDFPQSEEKKGRGDCEKRNFCQVIAKKPQNSTKDSDLDAQKLIAKSKN